MNDTTTHSHHPYIQVVPFCQLCTQKDFLHALSLFTPTLNEHVTQHCSLHSFPHKGQSISAMLSSNKINLKLPTYHADPVLLTVSAYKTELAIPAMPSSNYIAATHAQCNTLSMHINMQLHTHHFPPYCLPQPSYEHN